MAKTARRVDSVFNYPCPTLIEFLLDETGSMSSCKRETISGFASFLDEQKAQDGNCLLTLTKFDTNGLKTPYIDLDVKLAFPLNENTFVPGGGTNLRDTIGRRVRALEERIAHWSLKPNVLVVVLTDGDDNASREYSEAQIRDLIRAHEADGWTFVYLGSTPSALATAKRLGFQEGNSKKFDTSRMHETMTALANATTAYRAGGAKATENFFS